MRESSLRLSGIAVVGSLRLTLAHTLGLAVACVLLAAPASGQYAAQVLHDFGEPAGGMGFLGSLVEGSDGALYGTTSGGWYGSGSGTVFRIAKDGSGFATLLWFNGANGATPQAGLIEGSDGALYGTTSSGGATNVGTVFKINKDGGGFATLLSFNRTNGASPVAALVEGSDGVLYGTTVAGGTSDNGTVFKIGKDGSGFVTLLSFSGTNGSPRAAVIQGSDGALYGTTYGTYGSASDLGTVFTMNRDGTGFATLLSFDLANGAHPEAAVIEGSDGILYGTTWGESNWGNLGTVFKMNKDGSGFTTLLAFDYGGNGRYPEAALIEGSDGVLYGTTSGGGARNLGTVFKISKDGTRLTTLVSFDRTNGSSPMAAVMEASDGALYGTTANDGAYHAGTIFKVSENGAAFTTLYEGTSTDGSRPRGPIEGSDGVLYGTTSEGGARNDGTLFKIGKDGTAFTTLLSFSSTDGSWPSGLVEGSDGVLYGTTFKGGAGDNGTVFKIGKDGGGLATLLSFNGPNGANPGAAPIEGSDGTLYGTTVNGGSSGQGTVFKIGEDGGGFATLLSFNGANGANPYAELIEGSDGMLYGTTYGGGAGNQGTVFAIGKDGGGFTTLFSFNGTTGGLPYAGLLEGSDGVLYGATGLGPGGGLGTVFKIGKDGGGFTTLLLFEYGNGGEPFDLIEGSDGVLYGTAVIDFAHPSGSVFAIGRNGAGFTTLLTFNDTNGRQPDKLIEGSDGAFYGTTHWGGAEGGGVVFRLAQPPTADLSTTGLSFGSQKVETPSAVKTITVANNGGPLHVTAVSPTGANAGDFAVASDNCSGASVKRGGSCAIGVYFQPTAVGARTATLQIEDDGADSPQTVHLTGTGTAPAASLSSSKLVFSNQLVGTTSAPHLVTLHNGGTAPLAITSIAASGEFSETTTCGASLAKGASCTISVSFTPTDVGLRTGVLTIIDDAAGSPRAVSLSGAGIEPRFEFTRPVFSTSEAAPTAVVTVTRTVAAATATTIDYATSDGTATAGADYVAAAGHLSFAPGVIARTIAIKLLPDTTYEGTESFLMALSSPQGPGAKLGAQTTAVVAITDNDPVPSLQFSAPTYAATEGGPAATITVIRSGVLGVPVTVDYATLDGTAAAPGDYTAAAGALTFGPGVASRTFSVTINDDQLPEPSEYLSLVLSNPGGGAILGPRSTAKLTIKDNDQAVQFSASTDAVAEGAKAIITVKRTGGTSGTLMVDYATADGTATAPADYSATAGHLTFGPGVAFRTFVVPTVNDTLDEGSETVTLTLSNPSLPNALGSPSAATLVILDNEPVMQFSAPKYFAPEPAGSGIAQAVVTVRRLGALTGTVHVGYATSAGTAVPGFDYTETAGQLTFGPSVAARTFTVPVLGNTVDEPNPTVNLALSPVDVPLGTPSTAVLSITDNDVAGKAQLAAAAFSGLASTGSVTITVTRSGGTAGPASVQYATSDGTAVANTDYTPVTGAVTFGAGEISKSFVVQVASSGLPNRYFVMALGATTGNMGLGPTTQAPVWIVE